MPPSQCKTVNYCKELAIKFPSLASELKQSDVDFTAKKTMVDH
jgi:hypothetical protein